LNIGGQGERARIRALELVEEGPQARIRLCVFVGYRGLCVALVTIEGSIWNLSSRRVAAEKMKDAWTVFAAYKFACASTRRAKVVAL
jgi:hypothetical protein